MSSFLENIDNLPEEGPDYDDGTLVWLPVSHYAEIYKRRGFVPLAIPPRKKGPTATGWNVEPPQDYVEDGNIGLYTGPLGNDLADVDLDCDEAVALAPLMLPHTAMITGRKTRPRSHYFYRVQGARSAKIIDPGAPKDDATIVELRAGTAEGKALQTLAPPSIHPDGERVEFCGDPDPAEVDSETLTRAVNQIAAAVLVQRTLIPGAAHDRIGCWSAYLITGGMTEDDAQDFFGAICDAFGHDRGKTTYRIRETVQKKEADSPMQGRPTLERDGVPGAVIERVRQLLGVGLFKKGGAPTVNGEDLTDGWVAARFVSGYGDRIRRVESGDKKSGEWWAFDGQRWRPGQIIVERFLRDWFDALLLDAVKTNNTPLKKYAAKADARMIARILDLVRIDERIEAKPDTFDADPMLLNVENGTVDLRTGELRPHDRGDLITKVAGTLFDQEAACPRFEAFLREIFEREDDDEAAQLQAYMRKALGLFLTGRMEAKCFFLFTGGGDNGKSVLVEVLQALLGEYATETSVKTFSAASFSDDGAGASPQLAALRGARLITASEPSNRVRLNEGLVKNWTGRDKLQVRPLYREPFQLRPEGKLVVSSNSKPKIDDRSEGFWNRCRVIEFQASFPPGDPRRDPDLTGKLLAELPGILNLALAGCLDWQQDIDLPAPDCVKAAVREYRAEEDTVKMYIEERIKPDPQGVGLQTRTIYRDYEKWAKKNGAACDGLKSFGAALNAAGFERTGEYHVRKVKLADRFDDLE